MQCYNCGNNNANVQVSGPDGVRHYCPACAISQLKLQVETTQPSQPQQLDLEKQVIPQVLAVIPMIAQMQQQRREIPDLRCEKCSCTFREFLNDQLLSCPQCYDSFSREIRKILLRATGKTQHTGKIPARAFKHLKIKKLIERLKTQLRREVKKENYETAARIRDTIKNLEQEVDKLS